MASGADRIFQMDRRKYCRDVEAVSCMKGADPEDWWSSEIAAPAPSAISLLVEKTGEILVERGGGGTICGIHGENKQGCLAWGDCVKLGPSAKHLKINPTVLYVI